jgi:hypothetical protein
MTGGSRRDCACIKSAWKTSKERERKRSSMRVRLSMAGVMRAMDQLYVVVDGVQRILLICADAFVPFRTTIALVDCYDALEVARVIVTDIARWGAPLIWRFDRASSHMSFLVQDLLKQWGVLPLFGPAYHPGYYGQMERMNLEHRHWLRLGPELTSGNINYELEHMRTVLNESVLRPILNNRSSSELWKMRSPPDVDRVLLREEVFNRAVEFYSELDGTKDAELISWRWAIETALMNRGLLSIEKGAWG